MHGLIWEHFKSLIKEAILCVEICVTNRGINGRLLSKLSWQINKMKMWHCSECPGETNLALKISTFLSNLKRYQHSCFVKIMFFIKLITSIEKGLLIFLMLHLNKVFVFFLFVLEDAKHFQWCVKVYYIFTFSS
jgi:hypothetical protein